MKKQLKGAVKTLRDDGIFSLAGKTKYYLLATNDELTRDRLREINGPAVNLYDCFMFWKEYDMLELRLNTLDDIVDYFVIVEAGQTLQGDDKKLYFEENRERFSEFDDKIIHHVVEYPETIEAAAEREHYLRNSIQRALRTETTVSGQDEVIISDVDEIPNPDAIRDSIDSRGIKIFSQYYHRYYYNYVADGGSRWYGSIMTRYDNLTTPQDFRDRYAQHYVTNPNQLLDSVRLSLLTRSRVRVVPNGGWHFSFLGDIDTIVEMLETNGHPEFNKEEYKNEQKIQEAIEGGTGIVDPGRSFKRVELDDRFPSYLLENLNKFDDYIAN